MFAKGKKKGAEGEERAMSPESAQGSAASAEGEAAVAESEAVAHEPAPLNSKLAVALRAYGWVLTILGVFDVVAALFCSLLLPVAFIFGLDVEEFVSTLSKVLLGIQVVLMWVSAVGTLKLGAGLRKMRRRKVAIWSKRLLWVSIADLVLNYMTTGVSGGTLVSFAQIAVLIALSVRIDPTLREEREEKREEEYEADMDAAAHGMLGRDLTGKGYLRLDFFNLFWMFFICCILGLVLEIIWHMTVVDPGVYQDRAGLLIGPFSPIYGFGAVLITLALNRLYNKNLLVTFVVSGIVGGGFEWLTALFMKFSFGVTAWDYSDYTILGMPDPVAVISSGRTSTMFLVIWGVLGLVWVKFFLPIMLKSVNVIPWKLRYGLTAVVAAAMLANGLLTLGSLDCWFERASGIEPSTPIEQFYATYCNDKFMAHRFESMTMDVGDAARVDTAQKVAASE